VSELSAVLLGALGLKQVPRAGWLRAGIGSPESVAAHSWGVAMLALSVPAPELNRERMLAFALVHDLAEVIVGDITPHDGVAAEDKARREQAAAGELLGRAPELLALWRDYEAQDCPESRFVRQLDRLDMALQAVRYAETGADTTEFVRSAEAVIEDPRLVAILESALRSSGAPAAP
jgi:5'-deoxynucleotidase YfbR-like HD superfamily hydrolase